MSPRAVKLYGIVGLITTTEDNAMSVNSFAYALRARRKERNLTQAQLAAEAREGLTDKAISDYERGESFPGKRRRAALEGVLGPLPAGKSLQTPRANRRWRRLFKDRRRWKPKKDRSLASRLKTAGIAYEKQMAQLESVIKSHRAWLTAARSGSSLELLLVLLVFALRDAVEISVKPVFWGFRKLAIHDELTHECRADYAFPAIGFAWEGCQAVLVPQVPVKIAEDRVIVVDFLVAVRIGRRRFWFALEVDGAGHVSHEDELRARKLDVVRFSEAEILSPTFTDELKRRLQAKVEAAAPKRMPVAA